MRCTRQHFLTVVASTFTKPQPLHLAVPPLLRSIFPDWMEWVVASHCKGLWRNTTIQHCWRLSGLIATAGTALPLHLSWRRVLARQWKVDSTRSCWVWITTPTCDLCYSTCGRVGQHNRHHHQGTLRLKSNLKCHLICQSWYFPAGNYHYWHFHSLQASYRNYRDAKDLLFVPCRGASS